MLERRCAPILIAESNACEVWLCEDCGTINLCIGPVSMRLKQAHFLKAAETLRSAYHHLNTCYPDTKMEGVLDRVKLHH